MQNCQEIRLPICFMKKAWLKYLENIGKYHLTWQVWVVLGVKFPWKLTATAVFQLLLINKLCVLPTNNEGLKLRSLSNLSFSYDQSMVEDQSTNKKRKKKAPENNTSLRHLTSTKGFFGKCPVSTGRIWSFWTPHLKPLQIAGQNWSLESSWRVQFGDESSAGNSS